jgi:hypothetical protein
MVGPLRGRATIAVERQVTSKVNLTSAGAQFVAVDEQALGTFSPHC